MFRLFQAILFLLPPTFSKKNECVHSKPVELSQGIFMVIGQWFLLREHLNANVLGDFGSELKDAFQLLGHC